MPGHTASAPAAHRCACNFLAPFLDHPLCIVENGDTAFIAWLRLEQMGQTTRVLEGLLAAELHRHITQVAGFAQAGEVGHLVAIVDHADAAVGQPDAIDVVHIHV